MKAYFSANLHYPGIAEARMREGKERSGQGVFQESLMLTRQLFLPNRGKDLVLKNSGESCSIGGGRKV